MNEQVELWPKPVMYGTGFKITTHTKQYKEFQKWLDEFIMALNPLYYEARGATNEVIPKIP